MSHPDAETAIAYALDRLVRELPVERTYHSLRHTRDDVMPAAVRLARASGLSGEPVTLVQVAAAYHDIGFVERPDSHEICGMRIVAQVLPRFGFTHRQIEDIMSLILVTRLPQRPRSQLEEILADADLDGLGRPDFFERNAELLSEMVNYGAVVDMKEWYQDQRTFLLGHTYFTAAARAARDPGKARNVTRLEEILAECGST